MLHTTVQSNRYSLHPTEVTHLQGSEEGLGLTGQVLSQNCRPSSVFGLANWLRLNTIYFVSMM